MSSISRIERWTISACFVTLSMQAAGLNPADQKALAQKTCFGCHNAKLKSGGVNLSNFDWTHPSSDVALAEKIIRRVRTGMMPPRGMPRPDPGVKHDFVAGLQSEIDKAAALDQNPGAPPLHRLNRTEYANSVRELLDLDIDPAALLPTDDLTHGFDNMADALTISPTLVEAYVRAAGKVSRQAVGEQQVSRQHATYTLPRVISQTRYVEGAPVGTRGGISQMHNFPVDGEYVVRLTFYFHQMGTTLFGRTLGKGQQIEVSVNGERKALFDINPMMKQNEELRTPPMFVKAGPQRITAAFPLKFEGTVDDLLTPVEQSLVDVNVSSIPGLTTQPHVHDMIIDGPVSGGGVSDTPSRRRIFTCAVQETAADVPCAKRILTGLARRAYRRPVTPADTDRLLTLYIAGRNRGGFESGVQAALQGILANPEFVFRFERQPSRIAPNANYRITDLELASRLSYFLWSSAPDEHLVQLAVTGSLHKPQVLEAQVRRMLADRRSTALASNFASQWLNLQNLKESLPDSLMFPNFDRNLARSMRQETELLFENIQHQDRPVTELLTADYTFVDERLAKHYGIPNILGNRFRRVPVTDDNRRGILGHGSILTLTSVANRTAPVIRGKWVMDVLLGTAPPPPPPNVPALKEVVDGVRPISVRERLKEHRANPTCASCHKLMDPIGFALENFDATGVWRTKDNGFAIDPTGDMFDGQHLDSPASLRKAILNQSDSYLEAFGGRLLSYGVGRVLTPSDMPTVRAVVHQAAVKDNRFSAFVLAVVNSPAFQLRRAQRPEAPPSNGIIASARR